MIAWRRYGLIAGIVALYLGVVMAGMALPFATAWPLGLAAMLLYTVLMRPPENWLGAVKLPLSLLVLAALTAALVAAGRLLAGLVVGPPPWLGAGLAFAGVAVSRALWSAEKEQELDRLLDDALGELDRINADLAKDDPPREEAGPKSDR